ncbi:MAG TPA: NAD-dependent epimerase/dehydratase family protein [Bacteroidota bacterium]|nr:NAD-dependent epimerase/dehydratase family protein [Bacteroidota bacterium]
MKIVVTGAAGFIGSHLAERLAGDGHDVSGIDCLTGNYARALKERNVADLRGGGVDVLPLDIASDDLREALRDAEAVYHLAAQPGLSARTPFEAFERNNVVATFRLLEALRSSSGLRLFVHISTSSVYGANATGDESSEPCPTSYYGVTKLAAEQLVLAASRDRGFPACSMRLFSVYGPRERPEKLYPRLIRSMLEGAEFPLFEGSDHHLRSFTYVGDAVEGLAAALKFPDRCTGEIFNIGSDAAITTGEGIRIVERIMGVSAKIVRVPRRPGDQLATKADIAKARRVLGYAPRTPVEEGLAREVQWHRLGEKEQT